jgi:hypothetical protein
MICNNCFCFLWFRQLRNHQHADLVRWLSNDSHLSGGKRNGMFIISSIHGKSLKSDANGYDQVVLFSPCLVLHSKQQLGKI